MSDLYLQRHYGRKWVKTQTKKPSNDSLGVSEVIERVNE